MATVFTASNVFLGLMAASTAASIYSMTNQPDAPSFEPQDQFIDKTDIQEEEETKDIVLDEEDTERKKQGIAQFTIERDKAISTPTTGIQLSTNANKKKPVGVQI